MLVGYVFNMQHVINEDIFVGVFFTLQLFRMTGYNALVEFNEDDLLLGLTWKINLPIFQEPDVRLSLESIMLITCLLIGTS